MQKHVNEMPRMAKRIRDALHFSRSEMHQDVKTMQISEAFKSGDPSLVIRTMDKPINQMPRIAWRLQHARNFASSQNLPGNRL